MTVIQILWVWLLHRYLSHLSFPSSFSSWIVVGESLKCFVVLCEKKCASVFKKLQFQASFSSRNNRVTFAVVFKKKNIEPPSRQGHKRVRQNMFWKHCNFFCILSPDFCGRNIAMGRLLNRREEDLSTYGICSHAIVRVWRIWWIYKHFRN